MWYCTVSPHIFLPLKALNEIVKLPLPCGNFFLSLVFLSILATDLILYIIAVAQSTSH